MMVSRLILNDFVFYGHSFGAKKSVSAEVVFQTGMTGYVESLTDPSYLNMILVCTYPLIGNYGVPDSCHFESDRVQVAGLIVANYSPEYSHWQATKSLSDWLIENDVPAITGIDTRAVTELLREHGTLTGQLIIDDIKDLCLAPSIILPPSGVESRHFPGTGPKILAIDCGMKQNQLRCLLQRGVDLTVINYDATHSLDGFDGIFISNGPGDPTHYETTIHFLKHILQHNLQLIIFGICLGHQLLALASGSNTYKMKYGNRGCNIPCQFLNTKRAVITAQNHGYAVDTSGLDELLWTELFINANDGSNEGLLHNNDRYFSVQFHPEAKPGPTDSEFLFDIFIQKCREPDNTFIREAIAEHLYVNVTQTTICSPKTVLVLGSGGLSIGQAGEFDYSGSQAIKAYKEQGLRTILVNSNVATIQTSSELADKVYFLPVTADYVRQVIELERPDCISVSFGGQTALNCGIELYRSGVLQEFGVTVLGTPIESVIVTEDRQRFKEKLQEINERCCPSQVIADLSEALQVLKDFGYPVLIRTGYALGGQGSGFAHNETELTQLVNTALAHSSSVIIDKSLYGWKEIEYEVVRDSYSNCITVCNMENVDPLGIHTGESIVVAPSQTLNDAEYQLLRTTAIKIIRHLEIVGECNIQYALNPASMEYYVVEVNARLSRSSALASKATGYPLAYIAAKLSLGVSLLDIPNSVTEKTVSCFEPALDYCVVKVPRWDLNKFPLVSQRIGSSMKSVGETMAIGRHFCEAFQKALRMANGAWLGFEPDNSDLDVADLRPTYNRMLKIANWLYKKPLASTQVHKLTYIDRWFLQQFKQIIDCKRCLKQTPDLILKAKQLGFSDKQIALTVNSTELVVRDLRVQHSITPKINHIDTVAAEFPCKTNYLYLTYHGQSVANRPQNSAGIIVLGSGVYCIGSSVEFDWCAVNCIRELRRMGKHTIMINYNPETVSTDYDEADELFFEEISFETVMDIYNHTQPEGIILSMGGQIPNNIAMQLYRQNVRVIGTSPENIDGAENRYKFSRMLDHEHIDQPRWQELTSQQEALDFCNEVGVGYPCLVRPSYVLSGAAMSVAFNDKDLLSYLTKASSVSKDYPVVISRYIMDAKEIEVDAVACSGHITHIAISEHIENAGVHSGDATVVLPPQDLTMTTIKRIISIASKISSALAIHGPFNIQVIAKNDQIKVIECNLRVSRTFPFVSKTLGTNFISHATQIMVTNKNNCSQSINFKQTRIGVKVPQFSFNRLLNADIKLGVEMLSTGEVACFGTNKYTAYLKALQATGYHLPSSKNGCLLLSIGSFKYKKEFIESARLLASVYKLYGTEGTAEFYQENGIEVEYTDNVLDKIAQHRFDLIINISKINSNSKLGLGYKIRRTASDFGIALLTNIKCAKLFATALIQHRQTALTVNPDIDCIASHPIIKLPAPIDMHVHVREPGQTHKEDWTSCSRAAIAGGFTVICAMPNVEPPTVTNENLETVRNIADSKSLCDFGIYLGGDHENYNLLTSVIGKKLYLNQTFNSNENQMTLDVIRKHFQHWPADKVMMVHAEQQTLAMALHFANLYHKKLHVCHVSNKQELLLIREAKQHNINVTCEVCPHHLFLTGDGGVQVKPPLTTKEDQDFLWENLDYIDCFATDHAPHLSGENSPGLPGLETCLPLLFTAVVDKKLTVDDITKRVFTNPAKILGLQLNPTETYTEIELGKGHILPEHGYQTKCDWSPFAGMQVKATIRKVVIRGQPVYVDGKFLVEPGYGKEVVYSNNEVEQQPSNALLLKSLPVKDSNISKNTSGLISKQILTVDTFNRSFLRELFNQAARLKKEAGETHLSGNLKHLSGKVVGSIFYEPSTRTRCSFAAAVYRLGGQLVQVDEGVSSTQKGESIEDFIRTLETYCDALILRCGNTAVLQRAASVAKKPFINAGNGAGEHPTQALLDVFTIREELGTVNGQVITILGDLKASRTVHSLVKLLMLYSVRLRLVCPTGLELPNDTTELLKEKQIDYKYYSPQELIEILKTTDVLYCTRLQLERYTTNNYQEEEYKQCWITPKTLSSAKNNMIVLHPLPRVNEVSTLVDNDPRAAYFRQMENGLYIRMALLKMLL